jgi:hypothetical protein
VVDMIYSTTITEDVHCFLRLIPRIVSLETIPKLLILKTLINENNL